ncbi:synaptobrevin-domain-containing protein [Scheffersomyces coipomensis]|uniref:synaptobrevin-domain-containing protein n=1 Tax=Scheffersomyces coipomensis TaxID=1788519 RepID=UPI00315D41E3
MSNADLHSHLIHTTLTLNSTTLYTYENHQLIPLINNLNCSEIISQELGLINSSKTIVGSIQISSNYTTTKLVLYFMKKALVNKDGSTDLITVVTIAHSEVNRALIITVLKKIIDKYIDFKQETENSDPDTINNNNINNSNPINSANNSPSQTKSRLGEFKLMMNQIIKFHELEYSSNAQIYNYGAIEGTDGESSQSINPNQLLLANEEVDEVRQLMLDNINKLLSRGDKINLLVDQTDRLNTSSSVFQKRAQQIKRKMWFGNMKFILAIAAVIFVILYLFIGQSCGFPFFSRCLHN